MEDPFNPYAQWLGIARFRGRPNHYALLGLKLFESDTSAIVAAAERRMAELSRIESGGREPQRHQILAELVRAKETLVDAAQRKRYDELLRQKLLSQKTPDATGPSSTALVGGNKPQQSESPARSSSADLLPPRAMPPGPPLPTAAATADPMAPVTPIGAAIGAINDSLPTPGSSTVVIAPPSTSELSAEKAPPMADERVAQISDQLASARMAARKLAVRRQKAPYVVLASMLVLLAVVAVALAVGYASGLIHIGPAPTVAERDSVAPALPPLERAIDDVAVEAVASDSKTPRAKETKKDTETDSSPATYDAGAATSRNEMADANSAIDNTAIKAADPPIDPAQAARFKSELVAARKALGERNTQAADEHVAAAEKLAASDEQRELVAGFRALPKYIDGFWNAVEEGLMGLEDTGELTVGSTIVSIVQVTKKQLIIRANGQNRRYALDELPAGIAVAIASRWFDERPDNKVYLGALYFVDPRTDAAEAKRLWEEAASAGVDVKRLLALLPLAE